MLTETHEVLKKHSKWFPAPLIFIDILWGMPDRGADELGCKFYVCLREGMVEVMA